MGKLTELAHCRVQCAGFGIRKIERLGFTFWTFQLLHFLAACINFIVSFLLSSCYILFLHISCSYSCSHVLVYQYCIYSQGQAVYKAQISRNITLYCRG